MEEDKAKKDSKTETTDKNNKKDRSGIIIITILISITIIFGLVMYNQYSNNRAIEQCLEIQEHPDLNYPCICYPSEKPEDIDSFVDENTEKYCRCDCDIGNNQTYTAYIIRAVDSA